MFLFSTSKKCEGLIIFLAIWGTSFAFPTIKFPDVFQFMDDIQDPSEKVLDSFPSFDILSSMEDMTSTWSGFFQETNNFDKAFQNLLQIQNKILSGIDDEISHALKGAIDALLKNVLGRNSKDLQSSFRFLVKYNPIRWKDLSRLDLLGGDALRLPKIFEDILDDKKLAVSLSKWKNLQFDPEVYMNVSQLITSKGYECDKHQTTTEDGFILTLHRILPRTRTPKRNGNDEIPVVLLQHGLMTSASNWVSNLVTQSLAFILADAGVDVWMGNSRGTYPSQRHQKFDVMDPKFWDWSFHEMAEYDLPALLDTVLKTTGSKHLYYIGHSEGCTSAFIQWSQHPHWSSKVRHFYALAPAVQMKSLPSAATQLVKYKDLIGFILFALNSGTTNTDHMANLALLVVCDYFGYETCRDNFFNTVGSNPASFNTSRLPIYISHNPQPTSAKNLLHWMQLMESGVFQHFDEGSEEDNMKRYGQPTPPLYDLGNFTVPTTIYLGGHDALASPPNVKWLISQIRPHRSVVVPQFEHMDFVWATDANKFVYDDILSHIFHLERSSGKESSQRKEIKDKLD